MPESLSSILTITGVAILITLLWGVMIAVVYWDTNRRGVQGWGQLLWLLLAALLPLVGFSAYWVARLLARSEPRREETMAYPGKRMTAPKRSQEPATHLPTIAGADLLRPTSVVAPAPQPMPAPRKPARSRFTLEVYGGPHTGQHFPVVQLPLKIGRGSSAVIQLDEDLGISRQHAELYTRDGALHIRDLQSAHGTYVNGKRISDHPIKPGDEITVGSTVLIVHNQ
jgi:hypothetical protein